MPLKVLITGAGCAGPALATFLLRTNPNHRITVVERYPSLRTLGQQIDIRAQGITIIKRANLLDRVKARCVNEAGMAFVDAQDREKARFGVNDSGVGAQSFTSEFEILRGDLVDIFYEASLEASKASASGGGVRYEFGKWITAIDQQEDGVTATFSDGTTDAYDLLVGADGQRSGTRRMVWGEEADEKAYDYKGLCIAYYSIPREKKDNIDDYAKIYHAPHRRAIFKRSAGVRPIKQVLICKYGQGTEELKESFKLPPDQQKAAWTKAFQGAGWQTEHLVTEGLKITDDFYASEIAQVKMDKWTKGRVVLLGDAGYCPSPVSGMGTTIALTGCYVLVGEIARHGDDVAAALHGYDAAMRPFVAPIQKIPRLGLVYFETRWGILVFHWILWLFALLRIDRLALKLKPSHGVGLELPEYPELKLEGC